MLSTIRPLALSRLRCTCTAQPRAAATRRFSSSKDTTLTKADLIQILSKEYDMTAAQSSRVLDTVLDTIVEVSFLVNWFFGQWMLKLCTVVSHCCRWTRRTERLHVLIMIAHWLVIVICICKSEFHYPHTFHFLCISLSLQFIPSCIWHFQYTTMHWTIHTSKQTIHAIQNTSNNINRQYPNPTPSP